VIGGRVLDVSALTDAAIGKTVYTRALVRTAVEHGIVLAVPTAALMAAWSAIAPGDRPFLEILLDLPVAVIEPLDESSARDAGLLLATARDPSAASVVAGHVAWSARRRGWPVVTAEPGPLRSIDPTVEIDPLP